MTRLNAASVMLVKVPATKIFASPWTKRWEILDPECDSPELAAMLLDAVRGPHAPYSHEEMRARADRAIRAHRRRSKF